ncbi:MULTISPECIES: MarR family transcriptional regulator [unclassified Ciceribacter]|uniref:MarR family winged helix-turn-helix transcriptional regulator n=1 Tax=unclassified Ciceribacter TaxID=2628820 RepID=UPI001FF0137D|nr:MULTISPECIES: MarR family transcriptional regulator [unclassified Ciceribacter]
MFENEIIESSGAKIDFSAMAEFVGYRLRRAQLVVYQDFNEAFAAKGLRPADFAVLLLLSKNPGLKQSEVAEALGIQRANFVAIVDGLEQKGLAERRKSETDRRVQSLYITPGGLDYLDEIQPILRDHEERIIARLGGREARDRLNEYLLKLYD